MQEAGDAEWFACLSERVPQPSFFRQSSNFTQLVSVSLVSLLVASSDLQLDQAQASITQSILHNLETWRGIGLKWRGGGGVKINKQTWIDFGKDLVGVGIKW